MKQLKEAAAAVKDETVTEFKSEAIVLNDVDEFCRAVGQANAEKQHQLEKTKADADLEEKMEQKIKAEQDLDIDVEEEYRKLKAARAKQQGWNELKEVFCSFWNCFEIIFQKRKLKKSPRASSANHSPPAV